MVFYRQAKAPSGTSMSKRLSARGGTAQEAVLDEAVAVTTASVDLELALRARISIDPSALDEEFQECPVNTVYLGAKLADATREHLRAKKAARRARALVGVEVRAAKRIDGKPLGVDAVRDEVELDPRVDAADAAEIDAEAALARAKTDFEAIRTKRDMLVQLGAARRAEWESDPTTRMSRRDRFPKPGEG